MSSNSLFQNDFNENILVILSDDKDTEQQGYSDIAGENVNW